MLEQYANPKPQSEVRYHFVEANGPHGQNAISHVRYADGKAPEVLAFTHGGVSVTEGLYLVNRFNNGLQP